MRRGSAFETLPNMDSEDRAPDLSPRAPHAAGADSGGLWLGLALLFGLLRFVHLGEWSLWIDEVLTLADFRNRLDGGQIGNSLGYGLVRLGVELCGGRIDEFGLRFMPALVGYLFLPVVYFVLRPWTGGRRAGLCCLVLAVSSWHLFWSQNARFYTFCQTTSFLGVALVLSAYLRGGMVRALAGFGIAALAALFHPSAVFALPVLVMLPFLGRLLAVEFSPTARKSALVLGALGGLGLVLAFGRVRDMWAEYAYVKSLASPASLLLTTGFYVTPLLGGLALFGLLRTLQEKHAYGRLVAALVLGSFAAAFVASLFARVVAQYVFFLLPWITLLGCWVLDGAAEESRQAKLVRRAAAFCLVVTGLVGCLLYMTKRMGERPRWREAYHFVASRAEATDGIFSMGAPVGEYYLAPESRDYRSPEHVAWFDSYRPNLARDWARFDRRAWYVIQPKWFEDWPEDDARRAREYLARECRLAASFPLNVDTRDLSLQVYVRD